QRGSIENCILQKIKTPQIHTTSLVANKKIVFKKILPKKYRQYHIAQPGDVLLARVGRGCMGKVSMVKSGEALMSDCIYSIRVEPKYRKLLFDSIKSIKGQNWLKASSHGVCAKVISKKDLLNMPIG